MAKCAQCGREMQGFSLRKICSWCVEYNAAQRGEHVEVQHVMNKPWERSATDEIPVTMAILAINILIYIMMVATGVDSSNPTSADLLKWGANFGPYTLGGEPWRLISHMFLHIGYFHLAMNMWCLYSVGSTCEKELGSVSFAAMYLVSGVAGGLGSLLVHPYSVSAGASGAIFGIFGCLIAIYKFGASSLSGAFARSSAAGLIQWAGLALVISIFTRADNAAHVGGLLAGFLIGALVSVVAPASEAFGRRAAIMLLVASMVGGGIFWVKNGGLGSAGYMELLQHGRFDEAIAQLEKEVARDPGNLQKRSLLASLYGGMRRESDAREQYRYLVAHAAPGNAYRSNAEASLAYYFTADRKFQEGEKYFRDLLQAAPDDLAAHRALGTLAAAQDRHAEAIVEFEKVRAASPEDPGVYSGLGQSYAALRRYDDAVTAYKKALELAEDGDELDDLRVRLAAVEHERDAAKPPAAPPAHPASK